MTIPVSQYTFISNTLAQSAQVNTEFNTLYGWANGNIDHSNLANSTGIYASDIKPTSLAQAIFGNGGFNGTYSFLSNLSVTGAPQVAGTIGANGISGGGNGGGLVGTNPFGIQSFSTVSGGPSMAFDVPTGQSYAWYQNQYATKLMSLDQNGLVFTPPYSFMRNKIINGAIAIDQRNNGGSINNGAGVLVYGVDRWTTFGTQASKFSAQQVAVAPGSGPKSVFAWQLTSSSAYTLLTTDQFVVQQRIEAGNVSELQFGSSGAQPVTISFWVKSSIAGVFTANIQNAAANRAYPFQFTIAATNTWQKVSITILGDTTGTWVTSGNGGGLTLTFVLGAGSTLTGGTLNTWGTAPYTTGGTVLVAVNAATLTFTDVQLESGSTATPLEQRLYDAELALCQRYCWIANTGSPTGNGTAGGTISTGYAASSASFSAVISFPVTMRANPTMTVVGTTSVFAIFIGALGVFNPSALAASNATPNSAQVGCTIAGATAGQGGVLQSGSSGGGASNGLIFSAEL